MVSWIKRYLETVLFKDAEIGPCATFDNRKGAIIVVVLDDQWRVWLEEGQLGMEERGGRQARGKGKGIKVPQKPS